MAMDRRFVGILPVVLALGCGGADGPTGLPPGSVGPAGVTVGAPCTADGQCSTKCIRSTCSVPCASDLDCPAGTFCMNSDGGMCAYHCRTNTECANGQICESEDRKGTTGKALVCRRP